MADDRERRRARSAGGSRWRRFLGRPQAPFELAYVGAFLVSLVLTSPRLSTREVATQPAAWLTARADSLAGQAASEATALKATAERWRGYVESPETQLAALPEPGPIEVWFDRGLRLTRSVELTGQSLRNLWTDLTRGRWAEGQRELAELVRQLRLCWAKVAPAAREAARQPTVHETEPGNQPVRTLPREN